MVTTMSDDRYCPECDILTEEEKEVIEEFESEQSVEYISLDEAREQYDFLNDEDGDQR